MVAAPRKILGSVSMPAGIRCEIEIDRIETTKKSRQWRSAMGLEALFVVFR